MNRDVDKNLADAIGLLRGGRTADALALLAPARRLAPDHAGVARHWADALHAAARLDEAVAAYQAALALNESDAEGWYGLGCAALTRKSYGTAAAALRRAARLAPQAGAPVYNLAKALFELGHVTEAVAQFERAARLDASLADQAYASIACIVPGSAAADAAAVLRARRRWASGATARLDAPPSLPRPNIAGRKLRVGYVSAFFGARNWMKPVFALLNRHDRTQFDVLMFVDGAPPSADSGYVDHDTDAIYDITGVDNARAADILRAAGVDVLVDLNGFSFPSRLELLLRQPAPRIVGWFNMFATTGMKAFDWLVGDTAVLSPAEEKHHCERIFRLPGTYLAFEVLYPVPDVTNPPCLAVDAMTFGCLGSHYKLTDEVLSAWAEILHGAPRSRLLVKNSTLEDASVRDEFLARLGALGVDDARITLQGRSEHFAFLGAYGQVDIALDTFPYNGGTTTTEALWQGVPVLTFYGDRWAARTSTSLLRAAGLSDWARANRSGYVKRAVTLANDPETPAMLGSLRSTMRERLRQSAACDADGLCAAMEFFYRRISTDVVAST